MEKLLTPGKASFLLDAPLEILHEESLEWLEEINFWKDECAFFYALILKRSKQTPLLTTKHAKEVERHLIYLSAERLDDLKIEVESHEKFLSRIIDNPHLDEQAYRSRHKTIAAKIQAVEKEIRNMKRKLFALAKGQSKKSVR